MTRTATQTLALIAALVTLASNASAQQTARPERVVGRDVCKRCHASEFAAWEKSSHNTKSWASLDHPKAAGFAKAIGVTNIKGDSACTQCHGTHQQSGGSLNIAHGNSCESCHGGAGGTDGWLKTHADFGLGRVDSLKTTMAELMADRARETPEHRAARDAACDQAGMKRSAKAFDISANCLNCHTVPNEKLVAAGHPTSSRFSFVEWAQGEVRHNFLLDASKNADVPTNWSNEVRGGPDRTEAGRKRLMHVSGLLADLAISLKNRAAVSSVKRGSLGDEANDRILDNIEELEELEIPELAGVLAAVKSMDKKTLKAVTEQDKQIYRKAAGAVAVAARAFVETHQDGNQLPDSIDVPTKVKGEVYQP